MRIPLIDTIDDEDDQNSDCGIRLKQDEGRIPLILREQGGTRPKGGGALARLGGHRIRKSWLEG